MTKYFLIEEPRRELLSMIMERIQNARRRAIMWRLGGVSFVGLSSIGGIVVLGKYLWSTMASSGFIEFVILSFSDWKDVMGNFNEYLFSLAESFPVIELSIFLGAVLVFFCSFSFIINNYKLVAPHRRAAL